MTAPPPKANNQTVLYIVLAAVTAGSVPPFAKIGLEAFSPFTLVAIRFFFAVLALLPFIIRAGSLNLRSFRRYWAVGLVGALNPIFVFIGLQFTAASVTPLLYAAIPGLTALYLALRGRHLQPSQLVGTAVGFSGVALIVLLPLVERRDWHSHELLGNGIICLAVLAFFIYTLMSKSLQDKHAASPIALTFYFALTTLLFSLPFAAVELMGPAHALQAVELKHMLAAAEVGIIGTGIGYIAYQMALKLSSELTAALFTYLQPVATILLAAILLGERITPAFIIGGALALVGAQIASGSLRLKLTSQA